MPKLPVLSGLEVVKILKKQGYGHVRTTGSHAILKKYAEGKTTVIPVPLHRELAPGTLLSIIHQTGLKKDEFINLVD